MLVFRYLKAAFLVVAEGGNQFGEERVACGAVNKVQEGASVAQAGARRK